MSDEMVVPLNAMQFVRGLDTLAAGVRPAARGRKMTFAEAVALFGEDVVASAERDGFTPISKSVTAAGNLLKERRDRLGLRPGTVASRAGITQHDLQQVESSKASAVRSYERVAHVLGLEEADLYSGKESGAAQSLGSRLRTLAGGERRLGPSSVAALSEAAWVTATQARLEQILGGEDGLKELVREATPLVRPAFRQGYELARRVRESLRLGDAPIESMRELVEDVLGIPVFLTSMQHHIAGATLDVAGRRSIVLNDVGPNGRVAVRRATLAHELCHLLFDADVDLEDVRVDAFGSSDLIQDVDDTEKRANAFAAELLAPQDAALEFILGEDNADERICNFFGVSVTLMQYQLFNGSGRVGSPRDHTLTALDPDDWDGREAYTSSYTPIRGLMNHPLRAGRFAALVLRAAEVGAISEDSAREWLLSLDDESPLGAMRLSYEAFYPSV